jgi:hypothetical protein
VSQGTADIASRSHEALGGTLDFITLMPGVNELRLVLFLPNESEFKMKLIFFLVYAALS